MIKASQEVVRVRNLAGVSRLEVEGSKGQGADEVIEFQSDLGKWDCDPSIARNLVVPV